MKCSVRLHIYRLLAGPPLVKVLVLALTPAVPPLPPAGILFFPLDRGNLVFSFRSNWLIICGFGIAFPFSYSMIICGLALMDVAKSFCDIFWAMRACMMALERDLSTRAMEPASVDSSNLRALREVPVWRLALPPAPCLRTNNEKKVSKKWKCQDIRWTTGYGLGNPGRTSWCGRRWRLVNWKIRHVIPLLFRLLLSNALFLTVKHPSLYVPSFRGNLSTGLGPFEFTSSCWNGISRIVFSTSSIDGSPVLSRFNRYLRHD